MSKDFPRAPRGESDWNLHTLTPGLCDFEQGASLEPWSPHLHKGIIIPQFRENNWGSNMGKSPGVEGALNKWSAV